MHAQSFGKRNCEEKIYNGIHNSGGKYGVAAKFIVRLTIFGHSAIKMFWKTTIVLFRSFGNRNFTINRQL